MLRSLGEERFMTLLANWHRGVHGKFKVPVFAHQELDLFKVFWSVMEKGGYDVVSSNKQWKVGSCPHRADAAPDGTSLDLSWPHQEALSLRAGARQGLVPTLSYSQRFLSQASGRLQC